MKSILVTLVCLAAFYFNAKAADTIIVVKDSRLDLLTAKQAAINRTSSRMTSNGQYKGYRLQVINTRNRDEAFKIKAELLQRYPEQRTYALYQSPYFKIRFGNFIDKEEAEKYKTLLSRLYPQGIYIIQDAIDYTPKDEDNLPIAQ